MIFGEFGIIAVVAVPAVILLFFMVFAARQYKRCAPNEALVVYGKVGEKQSARCIHGGGVFIIPLLQDWDTLSLEPFSVDINLAGALSKNNIRVNVPSAFTLAISTDPAVLQNAAQRLLGMDQRTIIQRCQEIIFGQLRLVVSTMQIEEINQDREKFLNLINEHVDMELQKIGVHVINVNIHDITDESGYIEAIGKKAAAQAVNQAKIDVAQQEQSGQIGVATASREQDVKVADQKSQAEQGKKKAESERRIQVSKLEADAVKGEVESQAQIAEYNATLAKRQADADRTGQVAKAQAAADISIAQKKSEQAKLEKEQLAAKEVSKRMIQVQAEADADQKRIVAQGDADAIKAKYFAEAEGIQKVLDAKAEGYRKLIDAVGSNPQMASTFLLIEQAKDLMATRAEAIKGIKIDKLTVWDSAGQGGQGSSTANFLRNLIGALPAFTDLANDAGIAVPAVLSGAKTETGVTTDASRAAAATTTTGKGNGATPRA